MENISFRSYLCAKKCIPKHR